MSLILMYLFFGLAVPGIIILIWKRKDIKKFCEKKEKEKQFKIQQDITEKQELEKTLRYQRYINKGFLKVSDINTSENQKSFKEFFKEYFNKHFVIIRYGRQEEKSEGRLYKKIYLQWDDCHKKYDILQNELISYFGHDSLAYNHFMEVLDKSIYVIDLNMVKTFNDMRNNAGVDLTSLYESNQLLLDCFNNFIKVYIETGLGQENNQTETEKVVEDLLKTIKELPLYKEQ